MKESEAKEWLDDYIETFYPSLQLEEIIIKLILRAYHKGMADFLEDKD